MSADQVQSALAANRDVPNCLPTPFQDCRDEIHIGIFFDGTGNNKSVDEREKKWSNIARLFESAYQASRLSPAGKVYAIYISGVGTNYNGSATSWLDNAIVWAEDKIWGGGAGAGGERRLEHGVDLINTYLRNVMVANAKTLGGTVARYATENCAKSFSDISVMLSKYRLIKAINISIFGFSRGAALARAFSNRLIKNCSRKGTDLLYEGHPLRINFLGLFDTVASFGIPTQNLRTPFSERELIVSPSVERCVHFIAAHELRFSFPVDLIRKNGKLAGNWLEKVFPGVHSDVGGGYAPTEQGVDNNYARIPLREMLREARLAGARIIDYGDIKRMSAHLFEERFECRPETEAAYSRYMAACKATGGLVERDINAHMKLYYSANGTMSRRKINTARDRSISSSTVKSVLGPKGMAVEVAAWRAISKKSDLLRFGGPLAESYAQYVRIQDWQLAAWDATAPDGVVEFISRYIHDSKVDFLLNAEPFSYFSYRGVDESTVSVWQEGSNWLRNVENSVRKSATGAFAKGKENLRKLGNATSTTVAEAADTAQQAIGQATDFAISNPQGSLQAAASAYTAATDAGNKTILAGKQTFVEFEKNAEKIYESGKTWVQQKLE